MLVSKFWWTKRETVSEKQYFSHKFKTQAQQFTLVSVIDTRVIFSGDVVALTKTLTSVDHDVKLVGVHEDVVPIDALVGDVDVAILQSLLYLESLEVEGVDVHFAESFPHAMNTVWSVTSVVGLDKDSGDHVHVVSVRNISELLLDHTHGLSGVLSTVERLEV